MDAWMELLEDIRTEVKRQRLMYKNQNGATLGEDDGLRMAIIYMDVQIMRYAQANRMTWNNICEEIKNQIND